MSNTANKLKLEPNEELWTAAQVADYLGYSTGYFNRAISKEPDFPRELRTGRRWLRSEVIKWATSN